MKKAGYSLQEIAFILQHKSLEALKHYLDQPTMDNRENFSKDLFKAIDGPESESDDDFQPPPPPKHKQTKAKKSKSMTEPAKKESSPVNMSIAMVEDNSPEKIQPKT